jgi:hypothetical protein
LPGKNTIDITLRRNRSASCRFVSIPLENRYNLVHTRGSWCEPNPLLSKAFRAQMRSNKVHRHGTCLSTCTIRLGLDTEIRYSTSRFTLAVWGHGFCSGEVGVGWPAYPNIHWPPLTWMTAPVIAAERVEHRKAHAQASSSGVGWRRMGMADRNSSSAPGSARGGYPCRGWCQ